MGKGKTRRLAVQKMVSNNRPFFALFFVVVRWSINRGVQAVLEHRLLRCGWVFFGPHACIYAQQVYRRSYQNLRMPQPCSPPVIDSEMEWGWRWRCFNG